MFNEFGSDLKYNNNFLTQSEMPTLEELDKIGNSLSTLKEILKVHITEAFTQGQIYKFN